MVSSLYLSVRWSHIQRVDLGLSVAKPKAVAKQAAVQSIKGKDIRGDALVVKKAPIFIDLTVASDSEDDCGPVFSHPLVTPRIPRPSSFLSKQHKARPPPLPAPARLGSVNNASASDSEDEVLLVALLNSEASYSDMDIESSSDEETIARPTSNLHQGRIR